MLQEPSISKNLVCTACWEAAESKDGEGDLKETGSGNL